MKFPLIFALVLGAICIVFATDDNETTLPPEITTLEIKAAAPSETVAPLTTTASEVEIQTVPPMTSAPSTQLATTQPEPITSSLPVESTADMKSSTNPIASTTIQPNQDQISSDAQTTTRPASAEAQLTTDKAIIPEVTSTTAKAAVTSTPRPTALALETTTSENSSISLRISIVLTFLSAALLILFVF